MSSYTVLIVDDDRDITGLLKSGLQTRGYRVTTANSGEEGLERIRNARPHLVILELMLPGTSGEEICRIVKHDPSLRDTILVIFSSKADLATKLECLNNGVEEYLVKPMDTEEVAARVQRLLRLKSEWRSERSKDLTLLWEKTSPTVMSRADQAPNVGDSTNILEEPPGVPAQPKLRYGVYRVESVAGTGGMGMVYKAHDEVLDRYVAVKVLSKQWSNSAEFSGRFLREAKLVAAVNHPGIAQIYTYGEENGESFFVMQWCAGGSVADQIRREVRVSLIAAVDIILQCARALQAAWARGVVHRDIKPSNIMFDENQEIKIVDFGIAHHESYKHFEIVGSPAYMAPEQAVAGKIDHRADIYSLGMTFYRMLYGKSPFTAVTADEWVIKHATEPFPPHDDLGGKIPLSAYQMIEKMTRKDASERYQKYAELIEDFERLRKELYAKSQLKVPRALEVSVDARIHSENLFKILTKIYLQAAPGVLRVSWGPIRKQFLIQHNDLILFESPQPDEDLWDTLVKNKLMAQHNVPSGTDLETSLNRLLFLQVFSVEDFKERYRDLMKHSILQVFWWPTLQAEFLDARLEHDAFCRIPIMAILIEAARSAIPFELIKEEVPNHQLIVPTSRFEAILSALFLPMADIFLASRMQVEGSTLETLQLLTGFSLEHVTRFVYLLRGLGAVEYAPLSKQRRKTKINLPEEPRRTMEPVMPDEIQIESPPEVETRIRSEIDSQTAAKYFKLAREKYEQGSFREAEELCLLASKKNPEEAAIYHLRALALGHNPLCSDAAEEAFCKAIDIDPWNAQYRMDLVHFFRKRGLYGAAIIECERALEYFPGYAKAERLLAELQRRTAR